MPPVPSANILAFGDHNVLQASGGEPVLQLLHSSPADLALLDVVMPGINGLDLATLIQRKYPATKIVLMSGYGPREIMKIAGKDNPHRIIWKPFKSESLLRMIDNVLNESEKSALA
jgi:two-component system response regulator YesN